MSDSLKEAIRLVGVYSGGRFDIWALCGSSRASSRAHVMTVLTNSPKRVPQAKAGIYAIRAELYRQAGIDGECEAVREDNFRKLAQSLFPSGELSAA